MYYSFRTRQLSPVLTFEQSPNPGFPNLTASRDGRTILFVQWEPQASLAMVENFQ
jgi:hypothetical protein